MRSRKTAATLPQLWRGLVSLLPAVAVVLGLAATLVVWSAARRQEQLRLESEIQQRADTFALRLEEQLARRIMPLERIARRWEFAGPPTQGRWRFEAAFTKNSFNDLRALEWVNTENRVRWIYPMKGNEKAINLDLAFEDNRRETLLAARKTGKTVVSPPIELVQGDLGLLVAVPIFRQGAFEGFILGVFDVRRQFEPMLDQPDFLGFSASIRRGEQDVFRYYHGDQAQAGEWTRLTSVYVAEVPWEVAVWPDSPTLEDLRSVLPQVVLGAGSLFAILLGLSVHFGLRARVRAHEAETAGEIMRREIAERIMADEKRRDSEERLRSFMESAEEAMTLYDAELNVVDLNPKALARFGLPKEEVLGRNLRELAPSVVEAGRYDQYLAVAREGKTAKMEHVLQHPTLGERHWAATAFPVGRGVGVIAADVTERVRAEQELRQSEEQFRSLAESTATGIWQVDLDEKTSYVNPAMCLILGVEDGAEVIGRNYRGFFTPESLHNVTRERGKRTDGAVTSYEAELVTADGGRRSVYISGGPRYSPAGEIIGTVGTVIDITDRLRAEQALRESEQGLALAQQIAHLGNWEWDIPSGALTWSDEVYRIFGYNPQQFPATYERLIQAIHPGDRDGLQAAVDMALNDETPYAYEHRVVRPGGEVRIVQEVGEVYRNAVGEPERMVGIVHDITERKKVEVMKNEFISTVSHELRTPLTSIRASLGLMAGGVTGELPEKALDLVKIAQSNSERLIRLVNDILDLEKIESGRLELKLEPLRLEPIVEQALEANRAFSAQYKAHFVLVESSSLSRVNADRDAITQVITNLLSNAAKFSPPGGEVEVTVCDREASVRVGVRDHGVGIPEEARSKIFEKFFQVDASDTRRKEGTGLGLSISKSIVEKHGGRIAVESEEGSGSFFYFDLPALLPEKEDSVFQRQGQGPST